MGGGMAPGNPSSSDDIMDSESVNSETESSSFRELLECPVCVTPMYPPILQCSNGHALCSGCLPKLQNQCPTCRSKVGPMRCIELEKVAASHELHCKYQNMGCTAIYPYHSILKHEAQCSYRPYSCPYPGSECAVVGDIPHLVAHLRDDHKVGMQSGSIFNHGRPKSNPDKVENAAWMLTVFNCFGHYFCLHFEATQMGMVPVYMVYLRFMGEKEEADKYGYSLEVIGNGEKKLMWEGVPVGKYMIFGALN
ncbi:hypothetical protein V6N13_141085 [Hibiscus sabdariffa]|uniref:RING-type E3 ubiquitin transferase n=1 Tax=Hibiscus sabdariffa TaxID=183260 RepID=A0ABR2Q0Z0_9ROSI